MLNDYFKIGKMLYEIIFDGEFTVFPFAVSENTVFDGFSVYIPEKLIGLNRFTEENIGMILFDNSSEAFKATERMGNLK